VTALRMQQVHPPRRAGAMTLGNSRAVFGPDSVEITIGDFLVAGVIPQRGPSVPSTATESLRSALSLLPNDGADVFAQLVGEFAFVATNQRTGELIAVRDHLGLRPLYYEVRENVLTVSDSLETFQRSDIDLDFVAHFIAGGGICNHRTVWRGVQPLPAGTVLFWRNGTVALRSYWPTETKTIHSNLSLQDAATCFREHVETAILHYLRPQDQSWAHLSGGLDSSSVVSVAEWLRRQGRTANRLGGTVTITDSLGGGSDEECATTVARHCALRNEKFSNDEFWGWKCDGKAPPRTDQPTRNFPFYAKFRAIENRVLSAGGRQLLTGAGPDVYFPTTTAHIADLVWRGHLRAAGAELFKWSVATRTSIWRAANSEVVRRLWRPAVANWGDLGKAQSQSWIPERFWRVADLPGLFAPRCRRGETYESEVDWFLRLLGGSLHATWNMAPRVAMAHPLLHQPLLAFVLALPHALRSDVHCTKPILRRAMRGLLPEAVRLRATKGSMLNPRLCWSFAREREQIVRMLRSSVLAELGCVEPKSLLAAVDDAARGQRNDIGQVYAALSLETWMSVRSGRYHFVEKE
jgi:asparagine synthase (glutamine-hydrolysing)